LKQLQVIYEDNHIIAINKPAGALVQADSTGDRPISMEVKAYIKKKYDKPGDVFLGTIHRLDRPVSGVLIFARTSKGLTRMNELLKKKEIQKTYWAISAFRPEPVSGEIKTYIHKDRDKNKVVILDRPGRRTKDAKLAETKYNMIGEIEGYYLIEVNPITGRPHQIRAHMGHIKSPIFGDLRYGRVPFLPDKSIALHCRAMSFMHPVKKEMVRIEAKMPKTEIWRRFKSLTASLK